MNKHACISRRKLLAATAAAIVVPARLAKSQEQTVNKPSFTGAIDAHVHVWTPDKVKYPRVSDPKKPDPEPLSFTPEQLLAIARPSGVERIVLIQMSFYRFDNTYMLETIDRFPGVFSGVGIVDHESGNPADAMKQLASKGVRGFRITAGRLDPTTWLKSDGMRTMWRTAADNGWAMCPLINPEYLDSVDKMCVEFPQTRVVIDHFARLHRADNTDPKGLDKLCNLARHKNTHVKTSAFYGLGPDKAPYTELGPMIRRLRDTFGADRLMWASDCPFQVQNGHTYEDSIALIRDRLDFLTADDRKAMLRGTAERLFFA